MLLIALLKTLWRLSYQDMRDWLRDWPALALACGLPLGRDGQPRIPSASQQCKRGQHAGAPLPEALFVLSVLTALRRRLIGARDLIIDSAPILAWRRDDPDAAFGHAPSESSPSALARLPRPYAALPRLRLAALLSALPSQLPRCSFRPTTLEWAVRLYQIRPRVIRLDAGDLGLRLIVWIHTVLGAVAIIPCHPKRQKNRSCLPPTWTQTKNWANVAHRTLLWPRLSLFSLATATPVWLVYPHQQVALTYTASIVVALAAQHARRPDLIRSPKRVLAHTWEGF